jgi:hypothetical protein
MLQVRARRAVTRTALVALTAFYCGAAWAMRCIDEMTAVGR